MTSDFLRFRLLLATFAGWISRDQGQLIAYLVVGQGKDPRAGLLERIATIVTPEPIMRWHKRLKRSAAVSTTRS
jgi:hypothetical protein